MSSKGSTVLLVDDDDDLREIIAMVLETAGYQVVGVPDGEAALRELSDGLHPGLILLDLRMPNIDGPEFLRHLHARPVDATPVVVLSGEAGADREAAALGVQGFLPKPVEVEQLVSTVQRLAHP